MSSLPWRIWTEIVAFSPRFRTWKVCFFCFQASLFLSIHTRLTLGGKQTGCTSVPDREDERRDRTPGGAGRWCFSFFFNIYLINQLPTACCGGLLEQLHRFDLLVQYCNMCAWKPCQRIVTCCVLPFVFLLALLGRLVSVCFLYQCSFNRG